MTFPAAVSRRGLGISSVLLPRLLVPLLLLAHHFEADELFSGQVVDVPKFLERKNHWHLLERVDLKEKCTKKS